jgi:hypothetical protein
MPAVRDDIADQAQGLAALDVDRLSDADHAALMRVCGRAAGLTASTIEGYCYSYRRYLGFLEVNRDQVLARAPADRFDHTTVDAYVALLRAESGRDVALATVKQLSQCLRVAVPDARRDAIKAAIKQLKDAPATRLHSRRRLVAIKALPPADQALIDALSRRATGIGSTEATRQNAIGDYRRFLGVVARAHPQVLALAPGQRITTVTVTTYGQAVRERYGSAAAWARLRALKLAIKLVVGDAHDAVLDEVVSVFRVVANGGASPRDLMPTAEDKEKLCSRREVAILDALEEGDLIDERSAMREATARSFRYCYLEFIACVARHDRALLEPAVRQRDLKAMLRLYLAEKKPLWKASTLSTALTAILRVLGRILPPEELADLREEVRDHGVATATQFWERTVDTAELYALGLRICAQARARLVELSEVDFPYRSLRSLAERYRNGLMILTLGLSALRVGNFSALAQGTTFNDTYARYRIAFSRDEVKNRVDIRITLTERVRQWFDDYLAWIRPRIVEGAECRTLWPSYGGRHRGEPKPTRPGKKPPVRFTDRRGKPLGVSQIQRIVPGIVEYELGYALTCHDFRRSAASYATSGWEGPDDAARAPGYHRSARVNDRSYNSPLSVRADTLDDLAIAADSAPWSQQA